MTGLGVKSAGLMRKRLDSLGLYGPFRVAVNIVASNEDGPPCYTPGKAAMYR